MRPAIRMTAIALRAHRIGVAVLFCLGLAFPIIEGAAYRASIGSGSPAAREAFGRTTEALGVQLAYLVPLPVDPSTAAGYVLWRGLGFLPVCLAAWALISASGAIRNEEERGLLESWLASGVSRLGIIIARTLAGAVVAAWFCLWMGLGTWIGIAAGGASVGAGAILEQAVALYGLTLACFAIGLLAAQVGRSRWGSVTLGGALLLALFMIDSLSRVRRGLGAWVDISPFHL